MFVLNNNCLFKYEEPDDIFILHVVEKDKVIITLISNNIVIVIF